MSSDSQLWDNLLEWAKKRGMDTDTILVELDTKPPSGRGLYLSRDVAPSTVLFTLPQELLINVKTLESILPHLYETTDWDEKRLKTLTATQVLTLWLFVCRYSPAGRVATQFQPYIAVLPRNFSDHPLTWHIVQPGDQRLSHIPPSISVALTKLVTEFKRDSIAVHSELRSHNKHLPSSDHPQFLEPYVWAWLCVNTRTVYHRLFASQRDDRNMSLCPVLDMANHHSSRLRSTSSDPIPHFRSPPESTLKKGDEIFLHYGDHSNAFLFVHYGFVSFDVEAEASLNIDDIVLSIMGSRSKEYGDRMQYLLENWGYWMDWTFHKLPAPGHPSYRTLPALRLLSLGEWELRGEKSAHMALWEKQVAGIISWDDTGEDRATKILNDEWRKRTDNLLFDICRRIKDRGSVSLGKCIRDSRLERLWEEEVSICTDIERAVEAGQSVWS